MAKPKILRSATRAKHDENRPAGLAKNMLALELIGDGLVALIWPKRQLNLWNVGPKPYRKLTTAVARRPMLVRAIGAAEVAAALWWTRRIYRVHAVG